MPILIGQRGCADSTAVLSFVCNKTSFSSDESFSWVYLWNDFGRGLKIFQEDTVQRFNIITCASI